MRKKRLPPGSRANDAKRTVPGQGAEPFVVAAEAVRTPIIFTDAKRDGHPIVFVNESCDALFDCESGALLGRDFAALMAEPDDPATLARLRAAFLGDGAASIELDCRSKSGRRFAAAISISPVRDESGVVRHFLSFVDLNEHCEWLGEERLALHADHKRALQRLLACQTELIHISRVCAMGTMAATLAHELNQPLTAISNYTMACRMLLASDRKREADLAEGLAAIEDNAMRAGAIIRWLRDMTKRGSTKRELFDLNDAVRESVEVVRAAGCDGVQIESESDGALMIEADRVQIQQVVMNLAKNGCEAAAGVEDGRVIVSTKAEADRAIVSVGDTGGGIPPDQSARLFEWTDSAKPDGMGIGLSISRTIVEAHEGDIWLEDGREGRTRFCFSVPRESRPAAAPAAIGA
ncbi:MAG TPA: ATP-binding protein [Allosphingosinicella sp.]|jgi:two-component system sensor kinase FixL|nr:ATP-binding protein [Allosphingosinicella sp.]